MIIAPNDPNIVYSPYNWAVTSTSAKTVNAGADCRVLLSGAATVALTFDVTRLVAPLPRIAYQVDDGPVTVVPIAATVPLAMPSTSTWAKHVVTWWVEATTETRNRWNAAETATDFRGFDVPATAATVAMPARPLNIMIPTDSIGEGVRALRRDAASGQDVDRNSAEYAWPRQLAKLLPAAVGVVAFGRQGWTVTGNGGVPALPNSWRWLWSGTPRSFDPVPDIVIVVEGANDGTADTTAVQVATYRDMLATLPTTRFIAVRPFNGAQASNIQTAVATVADPRLTYLDTTGWWSTTDASDALHPYGSAAVAKLAPEIAAHILDILAADAISVHSGRYIYSGTDWVAV